MPWTDDVPEPERDLDELRDVVAAKAGRLRNRRRVGLVSGAAALVAVLLVVASLPGGDDNPRRLQAADRPETSTTVDPSSDDTFDLSEVYGEEPTTTVAGQTTSTTAKRKAGTPTASPTTTAEPCATPSVRLGPSETASALVGAWLLCSGASPVAGSGIEIRSDGRWAKLIRPSDGSLHRLSGWDSSGDWAAIQAQQVDFRMDGRGTFIVHASFTQDRNAVHFDSMGASATFVRVPSGTRIADAPPRGGDECQRDEGRVRRFSSEAEFRAASAQVWLLCQPNWLFASEGAGVEIRSDGRWSVLGRRGDGALVRGGGRPSGTWTVTDTSAMNGPGTYQISFDLDQGGGDGGVPVFATASTKMRLSTMAGTFDHVHAPAGAQVVDG